MEIYSKVNASSSQKYQYCNIIGGIDSDDDDDNNFDTILDDFDTVDDDQDLQKGKGKY